MHAETRLERGIVAAVSSIPVPAAPVGNILDRAQRAVAPPPARRGVAARAAVAAGIALVLGTGTLPLVAPGVAQTMQARIEQLLGWTPPPPPQSLGPAMRPRLVTLETARAALPFPLVVPAGLPADVSSVRIFEAVPGVYSKESGTWRLGAPELQFRYRRTNGTQFTVRVERFDPRSGAPGRYIYDADVRGADGMPARFEVFAWRNGAQMTTAIAQDGLTAAEIAAIRSAMGGVTIPPATQAQRQARTVTKLRVAP